MFLFRRLPRTSRNRRLCSGLEPASMSLSGFLRLRLRLRLLSTGPISGSLETMRSSGVDLPLEERRLELAGLSLIWPISFRSCDLCRLDLLFSR